MKHKVKFENSNEVIAVHDYVGSLDMNLMNSDTYHWYLEYQEKNTFDLYSCRSWYRNDRDRLRILSRFLKAEKRYYNDEYIIKIAREELGYRMPDEVIYYNNLNNWYKNL